MRTAKQVLNDLTLPGADAIRADARRFRQLVVSDAAQARTAALFAQGLQTRGPLELDLGDRLGSLLQKEFGSLLQKEFGSLLQKEFGSLLHKEQGVADATISVPGEATPA